MKTKITISLDFNYGAIPYNPHPDDWKLEKHLCPTGEIFDFNKLKLIDKFNPGDHCISGLEYMRRLETDNSYLPANENLLDLYVNNPDLIPEEFYGKHIFFFGTTFSVKGVECSSFSLIQEHNKKWSKRHAWLEYAGLCCPKGSVALVYLLE